MKNAEVTKANNQGLVLPIIDLSQDFPDLEKDFKPANFDLVNNYWTPEKEGEAKRVVFMEYKEEMYPSQDDPDKNELVEVASFLSRDKNGTVVTVDSASIRLLSALKGRSVQRGMGFLITYMGRKQNTQNSKMSDRWSIKPLIKES